MVLTEMTKRLDPESESTAALPLPDFSLVLGGPLFQLYRRAHLSGDALELLTRRVLVITLVAWAPLLLLSAFSGEALGRAVKIPFLYDIEVHVRFLIALPALIAAELVVHRRISPLIRRFEDARIVVTEDLPKMIAAANSALRARNSVALEVILLIMVYTLGLWIWRSQVASGAATWYATPDGIRLHLTRAGYWYAFVSIPIFQFLLLRWYMRLVLWFRLLWQISRLKLHLTAAHPDGAGGIGFIGGSSYAFGAIVFAQGALGAGLIANRILHEGRNLLSFKMDAVGYVFLLVLVILGPLVMFTPQLATTKRKGQGDYGLLAYQYLFSFEKKWIRDAPEAGKLLGTPDIQSLADLANSYAVVRSMRIVPFGTNDITRLAVVAAVPLLPLTLTIFSFEELLTRLIKILF